MAFSRPMARLARWHIWLGWLVGVPMLMWTLTGLAMVAKPIEEVRGSHLRLEPPAQALPADTRIAIALPLSGGKPVEAVTTRMERGEAVTRIAYADGSSARFRADGTRMGPLTEVEARLVVAEEIRGGAEVASARLFPADAPPGDFRKPVAAWQVELRDGTRVYVGQDSGAVEAVRTRWWRFYDTMWGLHIMDLQTREDSHNPFVIVFGSLSALGALFGCILMFRRRRARAGRTA